MRPTPPDETERIPLGQRLFDRPFLLLAAGLLVMLLFYTGWGMYEILTLPAGDTPVSGPGAEILSGLGAPRGVWWRPAGRQERTWIAIAFGWCLVLFAMMPFWHLKGGQNPTGFRTRVDPMAFGERTMRFAEEYKVGEVNGIPLVAPPPGADVYLLAQMWYWYPALRLQEGVTYNFHFSSLDVNHGFGLYPANLNLQVIPGYDYGLKITPNRPGEYRIVCNEFCGIGHHNMLGSIVVEAAGTGSPPAAGGAFGTQEESAR